MKDLSKGIQRIEIALTPEMVRRLSNADTEGEMLRMLSYQHTGTPRFDPDDVLEVKDWRPIEGDGAVEGSDQNFVAVAVLAVARGHRVLAEFVKTHWTCGAAQDKPTFNRFGSDALTISCHCGASRDILLRSLRPLHLDPVPKSEEV